jgi:hypothetical protein
MKGKGVLFSLLLPLVAGLITVLYNLLFVSPDYLSSSFLSAFLIALTCVFATALSLSFFRKKDEEFLGNIIFIPLFGLFYGLLTWNYVVGFVALGIATISIIICMLIDVFFINNKKYKIVGFD